MPNPDEKPADEKSSVGHPTNPLNEEEEWDAVDEDAWESFPASDPPGHWAGADRPPEEPDDEPKR